MSATIAARRLLLEPGEVAGACGRLGLSLPPGFAATPDALRAPGLLLDGEVHPAVAATLAAVCAPEVGVVVWSEVGDLHAAVGVRGELGGGLLRAGASLIELSTWRATSLGAELARTLPRLGASVATPVRLPLAEVPGLPDIVGTLRATVVAPPAVLGVVVWLAAADGWLALEPAEVVAGRRWADVRPVQPDELGRALAPYLAAALT